jgi:hypothetical protein
MGRSNNSKRKMQLKVSGTSIFLCVAIAVVGGLVLKAIADKESASRIEF